MRVIETGHPVPRKEGKPLFSSSEPYRKDKSQQKNIEYLELYIRRSSEGAELFK